MSSGADINASPSASKPPLLSYGRAPSFLRRWLRRFFLLAWAAVLLALAYDKWGVQARLLAKLDYRQHECLTHAEPPSRVVFEPDLSRAQALSAQHQYELVWQRSGENSRGHMQNERAAVYRGISEVWQRFSAAQSMWNEYDELRHRGENDGSRVYNNVDTSPFEVPSFSITPQDTVDATVTAFLHERSVGDKPARLVVVSANWYAFYNGLELQASVYERAYSRAGKLLPGPGAQSNGASLRLCAPDQSPSIRLYAGQPDPNDASRCTFRYDCSAGSGTIEGRLMPDDTVRLRVLNGPIVPKF